MSNKLAVRFSSRWAMILTCMGMAVGTGNIWRFPREVAKNGGGSFLIPWLIFLFLWSIPLLMVELSVGQKTRRGPFGAFHKLAGPNFAWMGGFISICAMLIMCYYAVVTGWTLRYIFFAFTGTMSNLDQQGIIDLFDNFRNTPMALTFHFLATGLAALIVFKGARSIERLNKLLIPALVAILLYGAIRAVTMVDAMGGVDFLFSVDWDRLTQPNHWIAGLTQSAWSTGAGWGIMLAYSVYARDREDPVTTPMATGVGNNSIELIVGLMIFPAVFAIMGEEAVAFISGASWKGGIAFQSAPLLFQSMPGGTLLNALFFLGLAFAALTSLVSMFELSTRFFIDFNFTRNQGLMFTVLLCLALGTPSALSDSFFDNQDFVWGVGLIISGLFLAFLVLKYGPNKFREEILNRNATFLRPGKAFNFVIGLVMVEGVVLLVWWLVHSGDSKLVVHCLVQWAVLIGLLIVFRRKLGARMDAAHPPEGSTEET